MDPYSRGYQLVFSTEKERRKQYMINFWIGKKIPSTRPTCHTQNKLQRVANWLNNFVAAYLCVCVWILDANYQAIYKYKVVQSSQLFLKF